jgi:medium-chain acyl-[acyl-carrier-protein] hydrolase
MTTKTWTWYRAINKNAFARDADKHCMSKNEAADMSEPNKWLSVRTREPETRLRLFCLPHAGSGTAAYHAWKRTLPAFVELCPILLPGREVRLFESSYTNINLLIGEMTEAVAGHLDIPYVIFGHSMGALLAFELAQSIQTKGLRLPSCLFLSGRTAAQLTTPQTPIHQLPAEEFVAELGSRYGGQPQELLQDPQLRELFLPILRADLTLVETYQYIHRQPLDCPITAFAGTHDKSVSGEGLAAWRNLTAAEFELRRIPGDHFYLSGPSRELLLQVLCNKLVAIDSAVSNAPTSI